MNRIQLGISRTAWRWAMLIVFAVLALWGIVLSVGVGAASIPILQVLQILITPTANMADQIVWNLRLPRALTGAMVGADLAVSGAILQGVMRNPLADPHIIGISSGAGIMGMFVLVVVPSWMYLITLVAFIGAMTAAVLIYILAWKNGIKPVRIILAGVAVSAFLSACISGILIFYSDRVHGALMWMTGGLAARSWDDATMMVPYTVAGISLALWGSYFLNMLQLGDDMARSLGVNIERTRVCLTAVAALLAASAVSVAGLLGFVGLIVPHMVRLLIGTDYRYIIPGSVLLGAAVVTLSDTVARIVFAPIELPVGLIMACMGAPFFLFLLRREV